MSSNSDQDQSSSPANGGNIQEAVAAANRFLDKNHRPASLWNLASKELRETLRDHRTLVTLFLMPAIVYPLLGLLFQGFFLPTLSQPDAQLIFTVAFENERDKQTFIRATPIINYIQDATTTQELEEMLADSPFGVLDMVTQQNDETPTSLETMVSQGEADLGVQVVPSRDDSRSFKLLLRKDSPQSAHAATLVKQMLEEAALNRLVANFPGLGRPVETEQMELESQVDAPISAIGIIPLILTLMTITGAVYPAIDLTAGERERGTLESLIAAPVSRLRILLGKLVAVMAVALLTALLNIIGMLVTLWVFQLEGVLLGSQGLSIGAFVKLFFLLVVFAAFFSSILLAVTCLARSFKEGQAYLIPVMLFSIGPSLLALKPEMTLNGPIALVPLVNIVLLAREVLEGTAAIGPAIVAIGSTVFYSLIVIAFASKIFGTDSVLYGGSGSWKELLGRPSRPRSELSLSSALVCTGLLLPATFLWQGLVGRLASYGVAVQFTFMVVGLIVVFLIVPLAITSLRRVHFVSGYRLNLPRPTSLLAGMLLGLGVGPLLVLLLQYFLDWQEWMFDSSLRDELLDRGKLQVEQFKQLSGPILIAGMSLVPGMVEELFFRGALFQAMLRRLSPAKTILVTAILFGLFHLVTAGSLGLSRFVPTMIMGLLLGWICYRSGSVIPGMLLHTIHNAITIGTNRYQDELVASGWLEPDATAIPVWLLVAGLILTAIGSLVLALLVKPREATSL